MCVNVAVGVNFHQHRCHLGSHHVRHRHWLVQNSAILLKIHQNVYQGKLLIYTAYWTHRLNVSLTYSKQFRPWVTLFFRHSLYIAENSTIHQADPGCCDPVAASVSLWAEHWAECWRQGGQVEILGGGFYAKGKLRLDVKFGICNKYN